MCAFGNRVSRAAFSVVVVAVLGLIALCTARAEDADLNRVYATMKRLEERVAALEEQNRQSRQEAEQAKAELKALRQRNSRAGSAPTEAYAMVRKSAGSVEPVRPLPIYKAVEARPFPTWAGFNVGIGFGLGQIRTHETDNDVQSLVNTSPGFLSTGTNTVAGSFDGRGTGGMMMLSLGYNWMLSDRFLAGIQVEGGVSNVQAQQAGSFTLNSIGTTICQFCTPPTFTSTSTLNINNIDTLANRWLVSALLKGGWLADPQNLLYLIGGWTYGGFEAVQSTDDMTVPALRSAQRFGLNGITIGAGFERQFSPMWSLKGEYRFTQFQSKTVDFPTSSLSSSSVSGGSVSTTNSSQFSARMQSILVGVSHYFGTN